MHLQNQRLDVVLSQGKFSTSSPKTAPEMLASEVTPGLQQEKSPMPISLCHDLFIEGDQVEENSEQYRSNSETRLDMHK